MTNRERELYLEYMHLNPWATADFALRVAQALAYAEERRRKMEWTKCQACQKGVMLPLSDYAPEGATVVFKAWACSSNGCRFTIRIDRGQVAYETIPKNGGR